MKKHLLLFFFVSSVLSACKKDSPPQKIDDRKPAIIIANIVAKLSGADSLSNFTDAFKNIKLTPDETKDGVTIFAPLNDKSQINTLSSGISIASENTSVQDSLLRDYIVRGVHKLSDLTHGKVLTALTGRKINVYRNLDTLKIDNFYLSKKEIIADENSALFAMRTELDSVILVSPPNYLTEETFSMVKQIAENDINIYHKNQVLLDGILSHDAELDSLPAKYKKSYAFQELSTFNFNPASLLIKESWTNAYRVITKLNYMEANAPIGLSNGKEKIATIKALRAYIYIQLLSYFGNIVLIPKEFNVKDVLSNTDKVGVINFINNELEAAASTLPDVQTDRTLFDRNTVQAIQAKMALLQKNYEKVNQLTDEIINSSIYQLESLPNIFHNSSKEIIWNNSENLDENVKSYFYGRPNLPYIRYTEILLMNAEANLVLGNNQKAQSRLDVVLQRNGKSGIVNNTLLQETWASEMRREGNSFVNLIRWDTALSVLGGKGFKSPKNKLLPIPASEIQLNAKLVQNSGY